MGSRGNRRGTDGKFLTDTDISRASGPVERQLEAWVDSSAADPPLGDLSLASAPQGAKGRQWNQFAANERMFGIVPSYDEHMYTTEVNTQHPDFQARERRAAQLAKEIESKQFGANLDDGAADEIDEEDQYSGVARNTPQWGAKSNHNRASNPSDLAKFANGEAQKALASPQYLTEQERLARLADQQQLSADQRAKEPSNSGAGAQPDLKRSSAKAKSSRPASASTDGGKKKFNFSAASFKHTSFSPSPKLAHQTRPDSVSPSPGPMGSGPSMIVPPMIAPMGAPMGAPLGAPLHPGMSFVPPGGMPIPMPVGNPPPMSFVDPNDFVRPSQPVSTASLRKFVAEDYSYVASLAKKEEALPKIYFTPPTWAGPGPESSDTFYADQFSSAPPVTRPPMMMVPSGFMMPRFV